MMHITFTHPRSLTQCHTQSHTRTHTRILCA